MHGMDFNKRIKHCFNLTKYKHSQKLGTCCYTKPKSWYHKHGVIQGSGLFRYLSSISVIYPRLGPLQRGNIGGRQYEKLVAQA